MVTGKLVSFRYDPGWGVGNALEEMSEQRDIKGQVCTYQVQDLALHDKSVE